MKKARIISALLSLSLGMTALPTVAMTASADGNYDFNSDGLVNAYDAKLLMNRYTEIELGRDDIIADQATRENIDLNGDYNKDGEIDLRDAAELYAYIRDNNIKGDVNCDGVLDGRDASMILAYYARQAVDKAYWVDGEDDGVKMLGDFDEDGVIDGRDASMVLNLYLKSSVDAK